MFKVKGENFEIKYAYSYAFINYYEELVLGLYIKAEEKNDLFSGSDLHFNSPILLKFKPNEIKRWQEIAGKIVEWDDFPEKDDVEPHALLYCNEMKQCIMQRLNSEI